MKRILGLKPICRVAEGFYRGVLRLESRRLLGLREGRNSRNSNLPQTPKGALGRQPEIKAGETFRAATWRKSPLGDLGVRQGCYGWKVRGCWICGKS